MKKIKQILAACLASVFLLTSCSTSPCDCAEPMTKVMDYGLEACMEAKDI